MLETVRNAKNVSDIRTTFLKIRGHPSEHFIYSDLKDRLLFDLLRERDNIYRRIDFEPAEKYFQQHPLAINRISQSSVIRYGDVSRAQISPSVKDEDLDTFKRFTEQFINALSEDFLAYGSLAYTPRCGYANVISFVFSGRRSVIVSASPPQSFVSAGNP
jgi:hypothetical protein